MIILIEIAVLECKMCMCNKLIVREILNKYTYVLFRIISVMECYFGYVI